MNSNYYEKNNILFVDENINCKNIEIFSIVIKKNDNIDFSHSGSRCKIKGFFCYPGQFVGDFEGKNTFVVLSIFLSQNKKKTNVGQGV